MSTELRPYDFEQRADPTPEEIEAACVAIRATWSPQERRRRAAWMYDAERVQLPYASDFEACDNSGR